MYDTVRLVELPIKKYVKIHSYGNMFLEVIFMIPIHYLDLDCWLGLKLRISCVMN